MPRALTLLVPFLAALVCVFAWQPVLEFELLGWDSYLMIASGKVSGPGELFATFGEELMEGRYPLGRFWRPVAHLFFALDYSLWGIEPFGYHLTDLILLASTAALTSLLVPQVFRLSGPAALLAALVAGLAFGLHPLHFEILPFAARRADALAVFFTLLALVLQVRRATGSASGWAIAAGLACALALASKETGAIAVLAVVLLELALGRGRLLVALKACWPALLFVGCALAARTVVLGGLGGSAHSSLGAGFTSIPALILIYGEALLFPVTVLRVPSAGGWALAVVALMAVGAWSLSRRAASEQRSQDARLGPGGALVLLVPWALTLVVLTGTSGVRQGWYAFPLLPVWALGLGLCGGFGLGALHTGRCTVGVLGLALVTAFVGIGAAGSMLFDEASDFREASLIQREFLDRFERRIEKARPDHTIKFRRFPVSWKTIDKEARERKIFLLAPYSLEAYADLTLGEGRVRVGFQGLPSRRPPGPDRIDVLVVPYAHGG